MLNRYQRNHPDPGLNLFTNPFLRMYTESRMNMYEYVAQPMIRKMKNVKTNMAWQNDSSVCSIVDSVVSGDDRDDGG